MKSPIFLSVVSRILTLFPLNNPWGAHVLTVVVTTPSTVTFVRSPSIVEYVPKLSTFCPIKILSLSAWL